MDPDVKDSGRGICEDPGQAPAPYGSRHDNVGNASVRTGRRQSAADAREDPAGCPRVGNCVEEPPEFASETLGLPAARPDQSAAADDGGNGHQQQRGGDQRTDDDQRNAPDAERPSTEQSGAMMESSIDHHSYDRVLLIDRTYGGPNAARPGQPAFADEPAQPSPNTGNEIVAMRTFEFVSTPAQAPKMVTIDQPLIEQSEHHIGRQRDHTLFPQGRRTEHPVASMRIRCRAKPLDRQGFARRPLGNADLQRRRDDRLWLVAVVELIATTGQLVGTPEHPLRGLGIERFDHIPTIGPSGALCHARNAVQHTEL